MNNKQRQARGIGFLGTVARIVLGLIFLSTAFFGGIQLYQIMIGLIGIPFLLLSIQKIRLIWNDSTLRWTGNIGYILNMLVFLAFYLTPVFYPPLGFTSDIVLIFYGVSMLLSAAKGYAGCEITAISNWILGRDDQVGCVIFTPIDIVEARFTNSELK